ncbi:uncharacterized protein [Branchiostoma lanceolatum]|uniref:uncharacterized protein isoform X2 n=1 Tax=Branchiostoma lanceolatum TaxID=7740 RepID=UPI0034520EE2
MMTPHAWYRVMLLLLVVGGTAVLESSAAPEKRALPITEVDSIVKKLEELIAGQAGGDKDKTMDVMEKDGELTEKFGGDSWLPQTRQVACSSGYRMHNGICYKAFSTRKNFRDASSTCAADGGTLAMPKDAGTNAFLLSLKNAVNRPGFFWFGLVDQHQEGGWEWIDGTPLASYSAWSPGEPNNGAGDEDCAEFFPSKWNDAKCSVTDRKFICQKIPAGCPVGYVYHQPSRQCYKAFNDKKTYNAAAATCISDGGTLAMPWDTASNKFLIYLKNAVDNNALFRIGLTDHRREGGWMWDDNIALGSFRAWGPGEPNNSGCPSGYQQHGPNCYKAYNDEKSYDAATAICRADGGSLAMPRDQATHQFLITVKNQVNRGAGFWLGFNDRSQEGGWRYVDGTRLGSFQPWNPGEPNQHGGNEDCGEIRSDLEWNDEACSSQRKFICQISLQVIGSCGGNLPGSTGVFISPGYPQTYSDNQKCSWFISVPQGHIVRLDFLDFDLENHFDHVTVLDGCNNRRLGRFTGKSRPPAVSSSGRTMEVVFTTDGSKTERGFKARYYAVAVTGKREMSDPQERGLGEADPQGLELGEAGLEEQGLGEADPQEQGLGEADPQEQGLGEADPQGLELGEAGLEEQGLGEADPQEQGLGEADPQEQGLGEADPQEQGLGEADPQGLELGEAGLEEQGLGEADPQGLELGEAGLEEQGLGEADPQGLELGEAGLEEQGLGEADPQGLELGEAGLEEQGLGEATPQERELGEDTETPKEEVLEEALRMLENEVRTEEANLKYSMEE